MTDAEDHNPASPKPASPKPASQGERTAIDTTLIKPVKPNLLLGLRSSFLAGVVVAAPIGITVAIIYWFVTGPMRSLDRFVRNFLPAGDSRIETITQAIPGFGLLVAIIAIILLGGFAKNFFGRALIKVSENLVESMPIVRTLYRFFKNVFETALQQSDRSFKEVALVEYPRQGAYALAFVIGEAKGEIREILGAGNGPLTNIFVPTVPNPTSGFLLFVPRGDLKILAMSVEDAAKVVFSLGLVSPDYAGPDDAVEKLERLAEEAAKEKRGLLAKFGAGRG